MKKGNQFYLEFQIEDKDGNLLDVSSVLKIQFNIGELTKTYDGQNNEVTYKDNIFYVWLTEEETFKFDDNVKMDARILFKGEKKTIGGTYIESNFWYESLKRVDLDV